MLDLAISWLQWTGAIIFGIAIGAWFVNQKKLAVVTGIVGFCFGFTGLALHVGKIVWPPSTVYADYVFPAEGRVSPRQHAFAVTEIFKNVSDKYTAYEVTGFMNFELVDEKRQPNAVEFMRSKISEEMFHPDPKWTRAPIGPGIEFVFPIDAEFQKAGVPANGVAEMSQLSERGVWTIFIYGFVSYRDEARKLHTLFVFDRVHNSGVGAWTLNPAAQPDENKQKK
jgi:hypothetical protein